MLEVEDVAGALAWLGERGIARVALFGTSMGGMAAITSVAILGRRHACRRRTPSRTPTRADVDAPRPLIVAVVADSAPPEAEIPVANRLSDPVPPVRRGAALFDAAARKLGADPRETEPARVIGLVEPVPLLLIHGEADTTVPLEDGRRLAAAAGPVSRSTGSFPAPITAWHTLGGAGL